MNEPFAPGMNNVFLFAIFNAFSYQMVLGSPMVLYAKTLHASATVLGIIAGMMPLLVIFQIPAAQHVNRIGYKNFVFGGWGIRVMFIGGMAMVPLTGLFLNVPTQLVLLLMLLFGFNLSRGISSCAWLPWITALVPVARRGAYLTREAAFVNIGSTIVFCLAAFTLGPAPQGFRFAIIFAFSALMGMASLVFLRRIPDVAIAPEVRNSKEAIPWREIAGYPPFRKLLWLNVAWSTAYGGLSTFVVAYLKSEGGMSEQLILLVTAVYYLGGLGSLVFLGPRLDHWGSKPIMLVALAVWVVIIGGWVLIAGRVAPLYVVWVVGLQIIMGFAFSLVNMSNTRLAMTTVPVMGRNHFFAMFSVVGNLVQGVAPVLWGMMIDALTPVQVRWLGFDWNRFSLFFLLVQMVFVVAIALGRRLDEPAAKSTEALFRDLIKSPSRMLMGWWARM